MRYGRIADTIQRADSKEVICGDRFLERAKESIFLGRLV
jgi:hypothetical protein